MDASHLQFLITLLANVEEFKVDWDEVMKETGINRKGNTIRKLNTVIKNYGLEFVNNKFSRIEGFEPNTEDQPASPVKAVAPKTPKKRKSVDDGEISATKSTKKKRPTQVKQDAEVDGDEEEKVEQAEEKAKVVKKEDVIAEEAD